MSSITDKERYFIDSNIILYSLDKNEDKQRRILNLMTNKNAYISTQVLVEVGNVSRKKFHHSIEQVENIINRMCDSFSMRIIRLDEKIIKEWFIFQKDFQSSYRDSFILAAAKVAECSILYSEDMQHGQLIEGIKIVNPFL